MRRIEWKLVGKIGKENKISIIQTLDLQRLMFQKTEKEFRGR